MPRKKSNKKKRRTRLKKTSFSFKGFIFKAIFLGIVWGGISLFVLVAYYAYNLPDVSKINENTRQPSIVLHDRDGVIIATIGNLYGEYTRYNEFPKLLLDAVLSTEDRRFFSHSGVDIQGLMRAFVINAFAGHVVQGGSTITQQLAKIVYLSHERTLKRKLQELMLALYLENKFTKQQILTMYLNRIYTGDGNYGMDAAAKSYFGKSVREVNLVESAILAGLIKAPSRYSPANNPELSLKRAKQVLLNMVDNEKIKATRVPYEVEYRFMPSRERVRNQAPYFTDWIREQLPDYIGQYTSGDIEIFTTLDSKLQNIADKVLEQSLAANAKAHHVSQGAMLVMSPSGKILAMTGGKSYVESQFNRSTQALRQPGSAFKLFVYLAGLEKGYTPDSIMDDSPINIDGWEPENYNKEHVGSISMRDAFAKSINTVAVRLARDVGMDKIVSMAARLGITSEIQRDLSSALGTSEVTLLELTGAYAHMANYGNAVWVHGITAIKVNGDIVYKRTKSSDDRVLDENITAEMNDMLVSAVTSGTGHNAQLPYDVAGKTGTTQNLRDAWFIGFTSNYVAGVWMGNDNNAPMDKIAGGSLPALVWKEFMKETGDTPGNIPTDANAVRRGNLYGVGSVWDGILKTFGGR